MPKSPELPPDFEPSHSGLSDPGMFALFVYGPKGTEFDLEFAIDGILSAFALMNATHARSLYQSLLQNEYSDKYSAFEEIRSNLPRNVVEFFDA